MIPGVSRCWEPACSEHNSEKMMGKRSAPTSAAHDSGQEKRRRPPPAQSDAASLTSRIPLFRHAKEGLDFRRTVHNLHMFANDLKSSNALCQLFQGTIDATKYEKWAAEVPEIVRRWKNFNESWGKREGERPSPHRDPDRESASRRSFWTAYYFVVDMFRNIREHLNDESPGTGFTDESRERWKTLREELREFLLADFFQHATQSEGRSDETVAERLEQTLPDLAGARLSDLFAHYCLRAYPTVVADVLKAKRIWNTFYRVTLDEIQGASLSALHRIVCQPCGAHFLSDLKTRLRQWWLACEKDSLDRAEAVAIFGLLLAHKDKDHWSARDWCAPDAVCHLYEDESARRGGALTSENLRRKEAADILRRLESGEAFFDVVLLDAARETEMEAELEESDAGGCRWDEDVDGVRDGRLSGSLLEKMQRLQINIEKEEEEAVAANATEEAGGWSLSVITRRITREDLRNMRTAVLETSRRCTGSEIRSNWEAATRASLQYFIQDLGISRGVAEHVYLAQYLLEVTLLETIGRSDKGGKYTPPMMAAASLYLANRIRKMSNPWSAALIKRTGYGEESVEPLAKDVFEMSPAFRGLSCTSRMLKMMSSMGFESFLQHYLNLEGGAVAGTPTALLRRWELQAAADASIARFKAEVLKSELLNMERLLAAAETARTEHTSTAAWHSRSPVRQYQ